MPSPHPVKLSILIPVYNEKDTVLTVLEKVKALKMPKQIIVIDNVSTDGTRELLQKQTGIDKLILQEVNRGKGSSLRAAIPHAVGEYTVIQDGDLEYDPEAFYGMLEAADKNGWDAVYGSRILVSIHTRYASYYVGVMALTFMTNLLYGCKLTDAATTYKMVRTDVLKRIPLSCNGFDLDFELTNKLCKYSKGIHEMPVAYTPRTFEQGKKIRAKDGLIGLYTIIKNRFID